MVDSFCGGFKWIPGFWILRRKKENPVDSGLLGPRSAEVAQLELRLAGVELLDEDVVGLNVPMDDVAPEQVRQRSEELPEAGASHAHVERSGMGEQQLPNAPGLAQLHEHLTFC